MWDICGTYAGHMRDIYEVPMGYLGEKDKSVMELNRVCPERDRLNKTMKSF
jgi:hypothetical protein